MAYSVKTNALPWILRRMKGYGVYAEVVSDEEYDIALMSGFSDGEIVFNGPVKGKEHFLRAVSGGAFVNIDSERELSWLRELPSGGIDGAANIGVRVNVDPEIFDPADVGYQEDGFRFGFSVENGELERVLRVLGPLCGKRAGLHLHVNSVTRSVAVYRAIASYAAGIIRRYGLTPAFIDIGGGFFGGVPGKATPGEYLSAIREGLSGAADVSSTKLILEPGSGIVGSAVELHTTVLDVKDTGRARIVTTDGSRVFIDPLWLKKGYNYIVFPFFADDADAGSASAAGSASVASGGNDVELPFADVHPRQVVCGYTCMDHDRIMVLEDRPPLRVGDRIVYRRVGNYTVTFGGPFIRPLPPVYAEEGGEAALVRRGMTVQEYYRMESADE